MEGLQPMWRKEKLKQSMMSMMRQQQQMVDMPQLLDAHMLQIDARVRD